jgi:transcriptional regulator with XRE-family HTH domain
MASIDGPFLREQREMQGWTPGKFAKEVGISPQYLADIELKRRLLKRRPDLIKKMAEVLHLPVTKLYRDESAA